VNSWRRHIGSEKDNNRDRWRIGPAIAPPRSSKTLSIRSRKILLAKKVHWNGTPITVVFLRMGLLSGLKRNSVRSRKERKVISKRLKTSLEKVFTPMQITGMIKNQPRNYKTFDTKETVIRSLESARCPGRLLAIRRPLRKWKKWWCGAKSPQVCSWIWKREWLGMIRLRNEQRISNEHLCRMWRKIEQNSKKKLKKKKKKKKPHYYQRSRNMDLLPPSYVWSWRNRRFSKARKRSALS